ncbi:uncharacterized protein [Apostichopus japonicus]|uniref:uncharacterized protein n=1 Tax=Stichopus japonicus TaxID=307972 RepID=UPI003AB2F1E4
MNTILRKYVSFIKEQWTSGALEKTVLEEVERVQSAGFPRGAGGFSAFHMEMVDSALARYGSRRSTALIDEGVRLWLSLTTAEGRLWSSQLLRYRAKADIITFVGARLMGQFIERRRVSYKIWW